MEKSLVKVVLALGVLLLFCLIQFGFAGDSVVLTSFTNTAANLRIERTNMGDKIVALGIGSCGGTDSVVTLFDSSGTTLNHERFFRVVATSGASGSYNCASNQVYPLYDRHISSGITYSITGNPDVTIFWKDVSPGDGQ